MSEREQLQAFSNDLEAVITRYRKEFDLPLAGAVGVLQILSHRLIAEAIEDPE